MQGSYHDPNWSEQVTIPAIEGAIGALKINITSINAGHLRDRVIFLYMSEPKIEGLAGRVRSTVGLAEPLPLLAVQSRRSGAGDALPLGPGAQSGAQSSAQSVMILKLLQAQALSSNELQLEMGLQTKTGAFKRVIKDLLDSGQIKYTMPDKPNSRLQKYRLTPLGRAVKDQS